MTHYKLLQLILHKLGTRKNLYLSKQIGYSPHQLYRWLNKGEKLVLTVRALQQLYEIAHRLDIQVNKNELF